MNGKHVKISKPKDAMKHGIGYLPEDRKQDGIIEDLSVRENIILALQVMKGFFRPFSRTRGGSLCGRIHQATGYKDRVDGYADQIAFRRQSAKGNPRALAAHQSAVPDPGRTDARHRRRYQGRDSKTCAQACRRRRQRDVYLVRNRGDAAHLLAPDRHAGSQHRWRTDGNDMTQAKIMHTIAGEVARDG